MEVGIIVICLVTFFSVAEFFGRKKHIGRWWTFGLLVSNPLFGVLALIVSPSASSKPNKGGKSYKIWGWICIIFGVLNLIRLNPFAVGFFVLGIYLLLLSEGKVINNDPKDYFEKSEISRFTNQKMNVASNQHLYFLIINGEQSDAFTFEELKSKRIKENDLVWRNGFDEWQKAGKIKELSVLIVPKPPEFKTKSTPPPFKKDLI